MMKDFDLILRNAHIIDPEQGINEMKDIAFRNGKVAALENGISSSKEVIVKNLSGLINPHDLFFLKKAHYRLTNANLNHYN